MPLSRFRFKSEAEEESRPAVISRPTIVRCSRSRAMSSKKSQGFLSMFSLPGKSQEWKKLQRDEEMKAGRSMYGEPSVVLEEADWKLYLGSVYNANDADGLTKHGIRFVLNVAEEAPADCRALTASIRVLSDFDGHVPKASVINAQHYLKHTIEDMVEPDDIQLDNFEACWEFIDRAREAGENVLVHCMRGRSRSTSVVVSYLMKREGRTLEEAHASTKAARPIVGPHHHLKVQLMELECALRAIETSTMSDKWQLRCT
mmetsp:Transcript_15724/g.61417  ORF Transcript_15724/g.61417 Transcript_15724/m.61417 type:complete len:259 (+) Transcript_15724:1-777(+)